MNHVIPNEINRLKCKYKTKSLLEMSLEDKKHKLKRFFYYNIGKGDQIGYLSEQVVIEAFDYIRTIYTGPKLLKELQNFYMTLTMPLDRK